MRLGLFLAHFDPEGGGPRMGPTLAEAVRTAEAAGFTSVCLNDRFAKYELIGPAEDPILEAYTTLGFVAAHTSRMRLGALVTCLPLRHPGLVVKTVTTLDVLSGGRAWLGIGSGGDGGLTGVAIPPLGERMDRLDEALEIALQMWAGDESPIHGGHYDLERPLNSPPALSWPRPRILVGGGGERRTLRTVARYADACHLPPGGPELARKLDVLRAHCDAEGRDYDSIEKTSSAFIDVGARGERVDETVDMLRGLADAGIDTVHAVVTGMYSIRPLEVIGERVIPALA